MNKLLLILLLSSCVSPAPDKTKEKDSTCTSCAAQSSAKAEINKCSAGKPCYVDEEGLHFHAIQTGPNRAALVECSHKNN
jgi:hypothetical protein